jgi:FAD binding domain/Berberine and berberine like
MTVDHAATVLPAARRPCDAELAETIVAELRPTFGGDLIRAGDPGYEDARPVWNAMVEFRPGLIARCTGTDDVAAAVRAAARHNLLTSVRGGGHGVSGKALSDGGLTIDLTRMRRVEVDTDRRLVTAQGGCLLGDVDAATAPHGLVVPAGIVSETGLPGLALGGGIGWLSRTFGATCDNFESLQVVTATGEVLEADTERHPDLFWALRGGGGNFGVVTEFRLRAHAFPTDIRLGLAIYRPEDATEALYEYARRYPDMPVELSWHAALKQSMPPLPFVPEPLRGQRVLLMFGMYLGDPESAPAAELTELVTTIGSPAAAATVVLPFAGRVQRMLDAEFPNGRRYYTKEGHLDSLTPDTIDALVAAWQPLTIEGEVEIIGLGGAMASPRDDTAFPNRGSQWWLNFATHWSEKAEDAANVKQVRDAFNALRPWIGGCYANMLNFDEADRTVDAFGGPERYARLGQVKAAYDPTNMFAGNATVLPAT